MTGDMTPRTQCHLQGVTSRAAVTMLVFQFPETGEGQSLITNLSCSRSVYRDTPRSTVVVSVLYYLCKGTEFGSIVNFIHCFYQNVMDFSLEHVDQVNGWRLKNKCDTVQLGGLL